MKLVTKEVTRWGTQNSVLPGHCVSSTETSETSDRRGHKMGAHKLLPCSGHCVLAGTTDKEDGGAQTSAL
jgi:hypothetical protein